MALLALNQDDPLFGANMALAAGLLQGNFGAGLQGFSQALNEGKDRQNKGLLQSMQMKNYESEIEARKATIAKDARKQDLIGGIFGAGGLSAPQVDPGAFRPGGDGMGPTMPPSMAAMAAPGSRLANLGFDQLAALKANGIDLVDLHKYANDPLKLEQGATYRDRITGNERFMPKVEAGIAPDRHGFYNPLPGYADAQARIEGTKADATERAKAANTLLPLGYVGDDGKPIGGTQGSYINSQPLRNRGGGQLTQELQDFIRADAAAQGGPAPTVNFTGGGPNALYGLTGGGNAPARSPQLQGQLDGDVAKARAMQPFEAGNQINTTWLKTSYEPVKVAGDAANDMLTNVQVARESMRAMPGGTGWGAEAKATGAAVLTSLGVAPKNAEMFASNAQKFQSASMSNLQTVLNAAKGPQTEGDADRASKTFAQLKNTPDANEFILDLSEAKAQRDQIKARFYEQALPIARQKGDLQEVDREWSKRNPSVFDMPSMQRWKAKK